MAASKDSDLDLLVSCFLILESAVAYLASAEAEDGETMVLEGEEDKVKLRDILDAKQKSQVGCLEIQGDHGGQRLGFVDFASVVSLSAQFCLGWVESDKNCRAVGQGI